jgi:type I restriction enzyme S subunit
LVGKTAIYDYEQKAIYAGYLVRFYVLGDIEARYINFLMNSDLHRHWCDEVKTDAIGQSNINATKLKRYRVPLPPLEEQKEIVKKIESLFKICDELETQINNSKTSSQTLMQAVLKEAFENA